MHPHKQPGDRCKVPQVRLDYTTFDHMASIPASVPVYKLCTTLYNMALILNKQIPALFDRFHSPIAGMRYITSPAELI